MDWKNESEMFNQMADYYDKYRPGYSQEVIDTIIRKAGLSAGSKLLEIGSGSGKATSQFTNYGFEIHCIEPGIDLVAIGREKFKEANITFVVSRFEDYSPQHGYFDAIISAQAFHWLLQPAGYEKCAIALKENGYLAPFWNIGIIQDTEYDNALHILMEKHNAFTSDCTEETYNKRMADISNGIIGSGFFAAPEIVQSHWSKNYTVDEYYGYVSTGNVFVQNRDEEKQAFYIALSELAAKYSGVIERHYICELYLARKMTR